MSKEPEPTIEQIAAAVKLMKPGDFLKRELDGTFTFQRYQKEDRRDNSDKHWLFVTNKSPVKAIRRALGLK